MSKPFLDRHDAGRFLATKLTRYRDASDAIVLGLPRGGVPVASEIADALNLPLDVFVVRKLGVPGHEELAMGAIASGGVTVLNRDVIRHLGIRTPVIDAVAASEGRELERREQRFRRGREQLRLEGRTIILVDDGLATGSTMKAAIAALQHQNPARVVVAVPVGAVETCSEIREQVDELICGVTPPFFDAVGRWYLNFSETTDDEVEAILAKHRKRPDTTAAHSAY